MLNQITDKRVVCTVKEVEEMVYTVKQVSTLLHTNKNYVYGLINQRLLPALKLGSYKVRRQALVNFLEQYEGYDLTNLWLYNKCCGIEI